MRYDAHNIEAMHFSPYYRQEVSLEKHFLVVRELTVSMISLESNWSMFYTTFCAKINSIDIGFLNNHLDLEKQV